MSSLFSLPYQQTAYSRCACVSQTGEERCQNCLRHQQVFDEAKTVFAYD